MANRTQGRRPPHGRRRRGPSQTHPDDLNSAWNLARRYDDVFLRNSWNWNNPNTTTSENPPVWEPDESWGVPEPFAGTGPKGYTRSDAAIEEEVCDRLTLNGQIDATDINVTVDHREVTLDGMVDTRRNKHLAGDIAESVWGVADVHNNLRVSRRVTAPKR